MTKVGIRAGGEPCSRCSGEPCLTATMGERVVALCPGCDAHAPGAQSLLAYFAKHQSVQPQDASYVSDLLGQWLASLSDISAGGRATKTSLAAEAEAWWARYK